MPKIDMRNFRAAIVRRRVGKSATDLNRGIEATMSNEASNTQDRLYGAFDQRDVNKKRDR